MKRAFWKIFYGAILMEDGDDVMELRTEWVKCPVCGSKTRSKIRQDTILKRFPLFCPKCKQETLIEIENFTVTVIHELGTK